MSDPMQKLIAGKITAKKCKEILSDDLLKFVTNPKFLKKKNAKLNAKKARYLHSRLMSLVDEVEEMT